MAAEREIKTVLTLDDTSFSKGLKAASSDVKAAQAEMQRAVTASGRLGQGFRQATAKVTGLGKVLKAQKTQLSVLNQEYGKQRQRLLELQKALEKAKKEHGEDSAEVKKAADAYAAQSAAVNDLREKMAKLQTQMAQNKRGLTDTLLQPFEKAKTLITSTAKVAVGALAAGGVALAKFTVDADKAKNEFTYALNGSKATFKEWNVFLAQEAKDAWKTLGLSQAEYLSVANQIGQQLEKAGVSVHTAAGWVAEAFELAGQLSSRFGVPVEDVMNDIASAATGENKNALDKYGISIQDINESMSASDQAAAVLKQAMKETSESAGQFETTVDSVESKTAALKAAWENFASGQGVEEDVVAAAMDMGETFGTEFIKNASLFMRVAPGFWDTFKESFSEGFRTVMWPEIANLMNGALQNIGANESEIPTDFNETVRKFNEGMTILGDDIKRIGETVADNIAGWSAYGLLYPSASKKGNAIALTDKTDVTKLIEVFDSVAEAGLNIYNWAEDKLGPGGKSLAAAYSAIQNKKDEWTPEFQETVMQRSLDKLDESAKEAVDAFLSTTVILTQTGGDIENTGKETRYAGLAARDAAAAFSSAVSILTGIGPGGGGHSAFSLFSHAGGLDSVPFDNYMARLHSGEMVLTADQAARYRAMNASGGNTYNDSAAVYVDKYYQYTDEDPRGLLDRLQALQRRQRLGYGH